MYYMAHAWCVCIKMHTFQGKAGYITHKQCEKGILYPQLSIKSRNNVHSFEVKNEIK